MPRKADIDHVALADLLRRVFGSSPPVRFERTTAGVSSPTYRVAHGDDVFYLRVAEESHHDLRIDASVHGGLRDLGVRVPEVVYVDPLVPSLSRSVLIMREIPGVPLATIRSRQLSRQVAESAGADAARFSEIPLIGFGWIDRADAAGPLRAELPTYVNFMTSFMPATSADRTELIGSLFAPRHVDRVEGMLDTESSRVLATGSLAHGDLDATAIFAAGGRFTGIIDFSELRGAEPEFDLGHFLLHDGETNPNSLYRSFRRGYATAAAFDLDDDAIWRSAVLSGFRQLCRWLAAARDRKSPHGHIRRRVVRLASLLDSGVPDS